LTISIILINFILLGGKLINQFKENNMKNYKLFFTLFAFVLFLSSLLAQDNPKVPTNDQCGYFYSNGDGNTINPMFTSVQPAPKQLSAERQALLNQLRQARLSNNFIAATELQKKIDDQEGFSTLPLSTGPETGIIPNANETQGYPTPFTDDPDYLRSTISGGGLWAVATQTTTRSNTMFAAVTEYFSAAGDQMRLYVSNNGGQTWQLKYTFNSFAGTVDCRAGELDIEPMVGAAGDTICYVVFGYTFNSHALSLVVRVDVDAGTALFGAWSFGGALQTTVNTYNPRVTSDNVIYGSGAYAYITVSHDSSIGGSNVKLTQRFAVNTTPFTGNTLTYRVANAGGGGFWWYSPSSPNTTYLWQDMCFYDAAGDRIYSVFDQSNINTLYIAWSNDYGVTNAGSISIAETVRIDRARISSTEGAGQQNLCIGYRRLFSGNDWDFRGQFTTTGGTTTGSFTANYPDFTTNESKHVDLLAIKGSTGRYVFGNTTTNNSNAYWRQTNSPTGATFGTIYVVNNLQADTSFGGVRAGYRKGFADSSYAVWSANDGASAYCSYSIVSTVGINSNSNEIPNVYSLSQNYPNPFNPVTNIKFAIPSGGLVKLVVYDIMGREVGTLVNQSMNAGSYTVDFDASSLSSGVYFYTISAGDFKDTKKMMLIK
jgi:hypothetical protein